MQFDPESLFIPDHNLSYVTVEADHVMLSSPTRFDRQPSPEQCTYISLSAPSASAPESTESQDCDHPDWSPPSPVTLSPVTSDSSSGSQDSDIFRPVQIPIDIQAHLPLPASSPGYLTYAQQQAMANRVPHDLLVPGGDLDPYRYTPVFLHDTLMLPGSLATLIGKDSPLDILARVTPARLPGYNLLQSRTNPLVPRLVPSRSISSSAAVTGLLLLGTGRDAREAIKAHYRPVAKRIRCKVVTEVSVPVTRKERSAAGERWRLEPRCVDAQVFVGRGVQDGRAAEWKLNEALRGAYDRDIGNGEIRAVKGLDGYVIEDDESDGEGDLEVGDLRLDGRSDWAGPIVWSGNEVDDETVEW